jgi:WD40 repeat protein
MPLLDSAVKLSGHAFTVWRVVPLPDGALVATASDDSSVRILSATSGAELRVLAGHREGAPGLAALGGDALASGDFGGTVRVWDVRSGECTFSSETGDPVLAIAAVGDGKFVAAAGPELFAFAHRRGRAVAEVDRVQTGHAGPVTDMGACDGRLVTAGNDGTVAVWDAGTLQRLDVLEGHTGNVKSVAVSTRWIVTGSWDRTVRVYDAQTLACVRVLDNAHADFVWAVALVGDAHVLSASGDGGLCVSDLESGALVFQEKLPFFAYAAAVTRDGRIAAAGTSGKAVLLSAPAEAAAVFRGHAAAARTSISGAE